MGWVLRLVEAGMEGRPSGDDVMEIDRPSDLVDLADLGLTQAEGKRLLARVQQGIVTAQCQNHLARCSTRYIARFPRCSPMTLMMACSVIGHDGLAAGTAPTATSASTCQSRRLVRVPGVLSGQLAGVAV
jgi:hypothetical protein